METQKLLISYSLLFNAILQHVGNDVGAYIRNVPIKEETENLIGYLQENQKFYMRFRDLDEHMQENLFELIQGNLCEILGDIVAPYDNCETLIKGSIPKGLIEMNPYILNAMAEAKDQYDDSDMSTPVIQRIFAENNFKEAERAFNPTMMMAYMSIDSRIIEEIQRRILEVDENTNIINIILGIVCTVMLWIGIKVLYLQAHQERYELKRTLTMLPIKIILANSHLKHYLKTYYHLSSSQI